jgi:AAA+ superfamily predicted ATPase
VPVPSDDLLTSLLAAVAASPDDVPLRLHLGELLLAADRPAEALAHVSHVLVAVPASPEALALLGRATAALNGRPEPAPASSDGPAPGPEKFDWSAAERDVGPVDHPFARPAFVAGDDGGDEADGGRFLSPYEIERPVLRLDDVGGMAETKQRLDAAFLTPMRNPELRRTFGKSLRGGLLLYGPPGCGKTFVARALAGEIGARFATVSLADVLDMWLGRSERNVHELFEAARRAAPCVVFLDEVDALGHRRSEMRGNVQRGTVNQLLTELDGVGSDNDGVFVLAASNAPWDVDPALRRPGRLDRSLLVLPPDEPAREAILRYHLSGRPVADVDLHRLAGWTDRFSGADLAHLVETAAEAALAHSVASGEVQPVTMRELAAALKEVRPSTGAWFATARNVAEFANEHGEYDELLAYLRRTRML